MALDPEIQVAVDKLDERISKLQNAKDILLSLDSTGERSNGNAPSPTTRPQAVRRRRAKAPTTGGARGTRKPELILFLEANGPTRRGELRERTGIPLGTISFLLNDKKTFRRLDSGKWDVRKEFKEKPPDI